MRRLPAALVVLVCTSVAYHASAHTTLDQRTLPPPSPAHASDHSRVVLFAGDRGGDAPPLSDTWEWDGARRQCVDSGPPRSTNVWERLAP